MEDLGVHAPVDNEGYIVDSKISNDSIMTLGARVGSLARITTQTVMVDFEA